MCIVEPTTPATTMTGRRAGEEAMRKFHTVKLYRTRPERVTFPADIMQSSCARASERANVRAAETMRRVTRCVRSAGQEARNYIVRLTLNEDVIFRMT